jgi:hypothetical protein
MRRSIATLLIALSVTFGLPAVGSAQVARSATLFGQIVDVAGRGSSGRTVELVRGGVVVGMATSNHDGQFSFAVSGASGTYVVRTFVNGHTAGVRISVVGGENPPMALLVLPSAATSSPQIGVFISTAASALASGISLATSVAVTALATQVSEKNDGEILADPATKAQVLELLRDIVQQIAPGQTFTPGQPFVPIPGVPIPPGLFDFIAIIDQIATNVPAASLAS